MAGREALYSLSLRELAATIYESLRYLMIATNTLIKASFEVKNSLHFQKIS